MADWDPFAIEEAPAAAEAEAAPAADTGDNGPSIVRIRKEEIEEVVQRVVEKAMTQEPWDALPNSKPDLSWHTHTCGIADWQHHDVRVEAGTGIVYVIFNRPNENNSMQDTLSAGINDVIFALHERPDIRVAVFTGEGRMYCAGGDPKGWQAAAAAAQAGGAYTGDGTVGVRIPLKPATEEVNIALHFLGVRALKAGAFPDGNVNIGRLQAAKSWHTWAMLPQFTICLANGSAMGGGVGCVCSCDYVISVKRAYFVLSEVKIGVIPATISPYVIAKIGVSNAKRFFCAAENLIAARAKDYGIVNEVVENMKEGHERIQEWCKMISECGPRAVQACKEMVISLAGMPLGDILTYYTCALQAQSFATDEAQEGVKCEAAGSLPPWQSEPIGFAEWPTVGVTEGKKKKN
uniref:3-hydroxyisobutyryl-coenzyme A hydrolase n=1 Tax=Alexandrium monilatum TaxID=311494 RepID=A0A7S4VQQ3_9DINO|mmetsp:Transcript_104023/g.310658  ORF Transcript_104023/g.310658 Transcript_104023/m.310658 type:complete len:406 (-) Transcript_104023:106-1323(-)